MSDVRIVSGRPKNQSFLSGKRLIFLYMYKPYPLALRAVLFYKNTEVALHTQAVSVFFLLNIPLNNIRPRRLSGCNNSAYTSQKTCSRQEDTCKTCARWFYTLCKNRRAKRSRRKEMRRTSIILIWFSYLSASFVFYFVGRRRVVLHGKPVPVSTLILYHKYRRNLSAYSAFLPAIYAYFPAVYA